MSARLLMLAKVSQLLACSDSDQDCSKGGLCFHALSSDVLAARKTNMITARARKSKGTARMLAKTIR